MKTRLLIALFALCAISATGQAYLSVTPAEAPNVVAPGSTVQLTASLQNMSPYVIYFRGLSYTASESFTGEVSLDAFASLAPDSLPPGAWWEGTLAQIQLPPGMGSSTGHRLDFYVDGGVHPFDSQVVAQVTYILDDSSAAVAATDEAIPRALELRVSPNPARATTRIDLALPLAGAMDLRIFDLTGRSRRVLANGWHSAGLSRYAWDGRDDSGIAVPPGTYFLRLQSPAGTRNVRILRLPAGGGWPP